MVSTIISGTTVRCLVDMLDQKVGVISITSRENDDYVVLRKGLLPLFYSLPKGQGAYISRAWAGELEKVIEEVFDMVWSYDATINPRILYTAAFNSYLSKRGYYPLLIMRRVFKCNIPKWDDARELEVMANCGCPEVALWLYDDYELQS